FFQIDALIHGRVLNASRWPFDRFAANLRPWAFSTYQAGPFVDEARRQFIRLMTRHERLVYGYILSLVPNWADADEILQETNIRLWEEFEKFQAGTNFAAWAIRVAHFQVLTWR